MSNNTDAIKKWHRMLETKEKQNGMRTLYKFSILLIIFTALLAGCEWLDPEMEEVAFDDSVNEQISNYLAEEDSLSIMLEALQITGYESLLNTYGRSTVFVPSNKAFENYFSEKGKSGITELSETELKELVQFHIVMNIVNVKASRTGLLHEFDTTVSGLRHFIDVSQGFDNIEINKTARISKTIELDNGVVYLIDNVLETHADNIYDYLASTGTYTIFVAALEEAGLKDYCNSNEFIFESFYGEITYTEYSTIFVESDAVFQKDGIGSLDQLKTSLSNRTGLSADVALADFVNYHFLSNISNRRFSFQMFRDENLQTRMQGGKRSIHIAASDILRPDPVLNTSEGGVSLNYKKSDVVFKNGVVHELNGILYIPSEPTKADLSVECEDIVFFYPRIGNQWEYKFIGGNFEKGVPDLDYHEDYSSYETDGYPAAFVFRPTDVGGWVEYKLPNVAPGTYDISLSYKQSNSQVSSNVNIYLRNMEDEFDWKTQLLVKEFDMSDRDDEKLYPDYAQDRLIRTVVIEQYGDYAIRFAHADTKPGFYDVIRLSVSENPETEE